VNQYSSYLLQYLFAQVKVEKWNSHSKGQALAKEERLIFSYTKKFKF